MTTRLRNSLTGRVLVDGSIVGAWGRTQGAFTFDPWPAMADARRDDVEAEAAAIAALLGYRLQVRWLTR